VVPGRVTWAHDPAAVTWGGTGPWWKDDINNQAVIDRRISRSIRSLTVKRTIPGHGAPSSSISIALMVAVTPGTWDRVKLIQEKADAAHWTWLTRGVRFAASSSQDNLPLAGFSNSQLVQRAIENQPLHYRKALLLCEVEEMPYQEICGNIGDPDRERYVAPAPSAEVHSRVTP
jgi:hypothetical protein